MKKQVIMIEEGNVNYLSWSSIRTGLHDPRIKNFCGDYFKQSTMEIKKGYGRWSANPEDFFKLGKAVLENVKTNRINHKELKEISINIGKEAIKLTDEILNKNISEFSQKQIVESITKLWNFGRELSYIGLIPVASDIHHFILSNELKRIVNSRNKTDKTENEYISKLLNPIDLMITHKEKIDRLKSMKSILKSDESRKIIQQHSENYCWIDYGYQGPAYNPEYFINEIIKDIDRQIETLENRPVEIEKEQELLKKELGLDDQERFIFESAREFLFLKAYRMEVRHKVNYVIDLLLNELSKRLGISLDGLRHLRIEEFDNLSGLDKEEVERRADYSVSIMDNGKETFLTGKEAEKFFNDIVIDEDFEHSDVIKGDAACLGEAVGRVKILMTVDDIHKVEKGDILVSIATSPDFIPAMERAAAFVTNSGGITSHAAIVAREMKKPCIIGTKIATKVLKDGDLVEVDANKGIVRVIK